MKYYKFKTFTTSYYFPGNLKGKDFLYGLYSPFGSLLSKIYWWLFRNCRIVRLWNRVNIEQEDFPYHTIQHLAGENTLLSFNMGSPGIEQKISILGLDLTSKQPFFAKFSQKKQAKVLTENEIKVYLALGSTGLTPKLLAHSISEDFIFFKAEYIKGKRPKSLELTQEIIDICLEIKEYRLTNNKNNEEGLKMSLSHGDFCPWNILQNQQTTRVIDWELAADRPLGYDLFTYICQVSLLFAPEVPLSASIKKNETLITDYFHTCGITNYSPYLHFFAIAKSEYEESKGNTTNAEKYRELAN